MGALVKPDFVFENQTNSLFELYDAVDDMLRERFAIRDAEPEPAL